MSNDTTYSIYRIVNFQNGKCYVGQTTNAQRRKTRHFRDLALNIHHSKKLQNAYNKYGAGVFYFEVIQTDIQAENVAECEVEWIKYYNSFHEGYNLTPGGDMPPDNTKPCTWNGITYQSYKEAGKALGVNPSVLVKRILKGQHSDADRVIQAKPCIWNGVQYPSSYAAAKSAGIRATTMRQRLKSGHSSDSDLLASNQYVKRRHIKQCSWNGIDYESIEFAASVLGITVRTMRERIAKGYTCDNDIPKGGNSGNNQPCTWNDIAYPSVTAAAKANNIDVKAMFQRLKRGYTQDSDMVGRGRHDHSIACTWNGIEYTSMVAAAKVYGVNKATMYERIQKGYTCDADLKYIRKRTQSDLDSE